MALSTSHQVVLVVALLAALGLVLFVTSGYNYNNTINRPAPTQRPVVRSDAPKRVLVTGAAGFIGFHLSRSLAHHKHNAVIGVDNFNDYYDVRLKIDRAYELHRLGIEVHNEDLCNVDFLEELFKKHRFTHVAHMAAQAGVRYSLENPLAYVHSNVQCQMALLNVLRDYPEVKLVYASSSSVYGKESPIPFRLSAFTDRPGNMYAATKKTDELLGLYQCHAHNLSAVGLRFFTVYGPWGRPDMAVYKFGEAIVEGKKVPMFHTSDDNPLGRDFTYVDDIVDGIIAALDYLPTECGERFNLGYGDPVSVPGLIKLLEEELGIPAQIDKLPLPPTEILRTWADISTSITLLGFRPKTDLKKGVALFAQWYLNYRLKRREEVKLGAPTDAELWFADKYSETLTRSMKSREKMAAREEWRIRKRYEAEVRRNPNSLKDDEIILPEIKNKKFIFHRGVTSNGGDIITYENVTHDVTRDVTVLRQKCERNAYCIGYTTGGALKYVTGPKSQLQRTASKVEGIYLADVDMCALGLHKCHHRAICRDSGRGMYDCVCSSGYVGDGVDCVPTLDQVSWHEIEDENFVEMHGIHNITQWKHDNALYRIKGVVAPGGDFLHVPQLVDDVQKLVKKCASINICIGFSTDGFLKKRIAPRLNWVLDQGSKPRDLVLYDVNYCLLSDVSCPDHSACVRTGPADWRCACEDPYVQRNGLCVKLPPIHPHLLPPPEIVPEGPASHVTAELLHH